MDTELHKHSLTGEERWQKESGMGKRTELWEAEVLSRDFMVTHPKKKKNLQNRVSDFL